MFLHLLSEPQKLAFLGLAHRLIAADSEVSPAELRLIDMFCREMGIEGTSPESIHTSTPIDDLVASFDNAAARTATALELIGLSHADGIMCADEKGFLDEVVGGLGFTAGQQAVLSNWVERQLALAKEASELIAQGPTAILN